MAKRFADTEKYQKPFMRSLKGAYKLLWDYVCLACNHAGIWIVDFEIAQIYIGMDMKVDKEEALQVFNAEEERIIEFDNGKKWFLPSFIEFQYGELNPANRLHKSVINILQKEDLLQNISRNKGLARGIKSPLEEPKDKDKDKNKDKDIKGGVGEKEKNGILSFSNQQILMAEKICRCYPKKMAKLAVEKEILKAFEKIDPEMLLARVEAFALHVADWEEENKKYVPNPVKYFSDGHWDDDLGIYEKNKKTQIEDEEEEAEWRRELLAPENYKN